MSHVRMTSARAEQHARAAVAEGRPVVATTAVAVLLDELDHARDELARAATHLAEAR